MLAKDKKSLKVLKLARTNTTEAEKGPLKVQLQKYVFMDQKDKFY